VQSRYKISCRDTSEGIIVGTTGTLRRPQTLLLGRYDQDGLLRLVARSTQLHPVPVRHLAELLTAAAQGQLWDGVRFTTW